jgi:hypothetical protein
MVLKTGLKLPQVCGGTHDVLAHTRLFVAIIFLITVWLQEGDEKVDPEGSKNLEELNKFKQLDFMPFDPRQKRTEGKLQAPDGSIFRISKVTEYQGTSKHCSKQGAFGNP